MQEKLIFYLFIFCAIHFTQRLVVQCIYFNSTLINKAGLILLVGICVK